MAHEPHNTGVKPSAHTSRPIRPSNRFGWDYRTLAQGMPKPPVPIIDAHAHIGGTDSSKIYNEVRRLFGVERTYTMTQLPGCDAVRDVMGDALRFIAFPSFSSGERSHAFRAGYLETIEIFRTKYDARMLKHWASPRLRDLDPTLTGQPFGATDLAEIDSKWRIEACELGTKLGMMFMVHIADPDTWFAAKYNDPKKYGTKRDQYIGLERMLDRFTNPWIAAHMGGWPEDLGFLDGMLSRHPNLHIDTSATKWVLRALGQHPREQTVAFFTKWRGRILFGSDIVVQEDHLRPQKQAVSPMSDLADSAESAFDLYASRYWALRTMFETSGDQESPIADPDLMMLEPGKHTPLSAPTLRGLGLPTDLLKTLYHDAAADLVEAWYTRPG